MPASSPDLPDRFRDVAHLEEVMTAPPAALVAELQRLPGDLIILGVGGKIGPTLARLAKRAAPDKRVVGVARFSDPGCGSSLPPGASEDAASPRPQAGRGAAEASNVVFMAGRWVGSSGHEDLTQAMNAHVPALVAGAFADRASSLSAGTCIPMWTSIRRRDRGDAGDAARRLPIHASRARPCSVFLAHAAPGRIIGSATRSTCATGAAGPARCATARPSISPATSA
jgi:hypothetical protein